MNEVKEGEVVEESKALTAKPEAGLLKNDPVAEIEYATKCAKALTGIINSKEKKVIIQGKQYIEFEDWQTIARFYNITVGCEMTQPIMRDSKMFGYEARAFVYNQQGVKISSAEASCTRDEVNWKVKPEFQLKSMAQTRASAKALRNVLAWVVVLAGYKATPAEEMNDRNYSNNKDAFTPPPAKPAPPRPATPNLDKLKVILKREGATKPHEIKEVIEKLSGMKVAGSIDEKKAAAIIPLIVKQ